jgi:hypothetical protein
MASQLPEQKLLKHLADNCADSRLNEVAVAHGMGRQPYDIQARWFNIILAYIYSMSHNYEIGRFPNSTYEITRLAKKMKDLALSDEFTTNVYEKYGDYEMENDLVDNAINLTIFDRL